MSEYDWTAADSFNFSPPMAPRKSWVIYGQVGNSITPIAYLSRPKWISPDDFKLLMDRLSLNIRIPAKPFNDSPESKETE